MIRYIIVDDEPIAHEIITDYASNFPQLEFAQSCYNAFQAMDYLNEYAVDLIFLDINMPKISGFEFLRSLRNPPKIIVTTAYKEHAIEGYELNVIDYLLKPFSLQRFLQAVYKVADTKTENTKEALLSEKVVLKDGKKLHQIALADILYIEAYGNYTKVMTPQKTILTLETLSSYLKKLPDTAFIQVHRSFIVQIAKLETVSNNTISIHNKQIPIGQTFKGKVKAVLENG
ncbi:LytTR family DNA-binding domain-containing protein [Flavobacteriaceae bacterium S356]|uniref:LytTR family DNA-binding domain-containing protein n=1 Tax=Asprobacillus argus TaxID=3076534 RepID=A0ABU3LDJ8_9FLAO|nr:LytTR family DNA-binding domain-containing protein [Flavobacteriaceae bacterium S356]